MVKEPVKDKKRDRYIVSKLLERRRRILRRFLTKGEFALWQWLRRQQTGYRFRRQTSIGNYIVDFYCHELRLIIEVDGGIHDTQKAYDAKRDEWLKSRGYIILRINNEDCVYNLENILQTITDMVVELKG